MRTRSTAHRGPLLTLVACLLIVAVVTVTGPDPATDVRRAWDDVTVGTWGEVEHASVRVDRVQTTRTATTPSDRDLDSDVTFVVVDYTASVTERTVRFSDVVLRTRDDHDYEPRPEFGVLSALQPGFTRRGTLVFEVPDARVEMVILVVDADDAAFDVYSRAIRVDLGLGPERPFSPSVAVAESVVAVTP